MRAVAKALKIKEIPKKLRAPGGAIQGGTRHKRLLVDQCLPTIRTIKERRADLIVKLGGEREKNRNL